MDNLNSTLSSNLTSNLNKKLTENDFFSSIEPTMNTSIKGIFLLILTVASNFNAETLGCRTQKFLSESMFGKHLLNFALIYFAINLTSNEVVHPNTILLRTVYVWIGYLFFIRMPLNYTILVFGLLLSSYTLGNYIDYYERDMPEENKDKNIKERTKNFKSARKFLFGLIPIVIIIGLLYYGYEKKMEYGEDFSLYIFIFGNKTCKSIDE